MLHSPQRGPEWRAGSGSRIPADRWRGRVQPVLGTPCQVSHNVGEPRLSMDIPTLGGVRLRLEAEPGRYSVTLVRHQGNTAGHQARLQCRWMPIGQGAPSLGPRDLCPCRLLIPPMDTYSPMGIGGPCGYLLPHRGFSLRHGARSWFSRL